MAKRGRPKSKERTELIHLRLPETTAKELRGSALGLSGEIRARLARSIADKAVPAETRELLEFVQWAADEIREQSGSGYGWASNTKSQEALLTAIRTWVETIRPPQQVSAVADLFGPDDPATLGRAIARAHPKARAAMSKQFYGVLSKTKE